MRLLVLAVVLAISGCFGLPPGSADFGDEVTIRYVALDAESGDVLVWALGDNVVPQNVRVVAQSRLGEVPGYLENILDDFDQAALVDALRDGGDLAAFGQETTFVLGSSGLRFDLDRALIGRLANETFQVFSGGDGSSGYSQEVTVDRFLEGQPLEQSMPRGQFEGALGEASVGQTFQYNLLHDAEVIAIDDATVRFRVLAEEGQSAPADVVGATLVTHVDDDSFFYELVPDEGATFRIDPPNRNQPQTPLGLTPGAYEVRGARGDQIVYGYAAEPQVLAGKDVEFYIEVVEIKRLEEEPISGNYGERRSPVLLGVVGDDHGHNHGHDDGHGHTH